MKQAGDKSHFANDMRFTLVRERNTIWTDVADDFR